MILRRTTPDGLVFFESQILARLGLPHAFSTRAADLDLTSPPVSPAPPPGHPYHRLVMAMGVSQSRIVWVRQVHGRGVLAVTAANADDHPLADALVTREPNLALTVRIADCVPLLLAAHCDGRALAVAAVHAGWRGLVAGVIPAAIAAIREELPGQSFTIAAAIGPCIGPARFEIGYEVAQAFDDAGLGTVVIAGASPDAKPHADLQAAALLQLRAAGVADDQIDRADLCTHRDAADFYSHRRDAGHTGRMAAVILLPDRQS